MSKDKEKAPGAGEGTATGDEGTAPEAGRGEVQRVAYKLKERGTTTGAVTGTLYTYETGDVIEAPDCDLDHVGAKAASKYATRVVEAED